MEGKKTIVHRACRQMLRPIASMLLRCGMTWKEFSDLSKSVFVEAATAEFGIKGRPTNVSRVSILTGISRKEVKRQRDLLESNEPLVERKTTGATNVLSAWFQDHVFRDANSVPMLLEEHGAGASFETLCGRYGGGIAPSTMLKELLNTGAVERQQDGRLKVLSRYYQPAVHDDENLLFAIDRIYDVVETMNNNVFPGDKSQPRFGGYADHVEFPVSAIPRFRKFLDERGQTFLEEVDDWLAQHAGGDNQQADDVARVGVALFATERPINQE
jgi:hypothetical protein